MKPQITVLTLGVDDLERALVFYRDGLGFRTEGIVGKEFDHGAVVFFDLHGGSKLALWPRASIAHDTGLSPSVASPTEMTIGHNVASKADVDGIMAQAEAAGARVVKAARETFWGGYAGYFQDPDGHLWEVVWNPAFAEAAMTERTDLFDSNYGHFTEQVLEAIRKETFGEDIGQTSWLTVDEYDRFIAWLQLASGHRVLEVATGSGGPARYLATRSQCHVTGIDVNEKAIATAVQGASQYDMTHRLSFEVADADAALPFEDGAFDGLVCIDSMNHFPHRFDVLREWYRVLRPGRRAVFTDPVVITGPVTNDELARRSSIGFFLFVPPGVNERLVAEAGFHLVQQQDVTENAALVSGRWHQARQRHREALLQMEGEQRFEGLQRFFAQVHCLTAERRLSRFVYVVEKPVGGK